MTTPPSKVTILFITANPPDWQQLDLERERKEFTQALRGNRYGDRFEVRFLFAAEVGDILQALRDHQPTVVHLSGHGDYQGALYFTADHSADAPALSAEGLAEKLQIYQEGANWPVRLVVLAACNSAAAARLVARHVDCAIGMDDDVGDEAMATLFTPSFYAALAHGENVQNAVASAKNAMTHDGGRFAVEDARAVQLFSRDGVDPTKLVLTERFPPKPENSLAHKQYLHALFKRRWATVKMKLFDPQTTDVVPLPQIYSPLPVDFSLRLQLDERGEIGAWWCGRGNEERSEREAKEAWEQALIERIERTAAREALPDQQARPRAWSDLRADENALQPLRTIASDWARRQRTDRSGGRETETMHWQAEAEHAALVQHRFVLIGDPGSGKSTFLRHLALSWAAARAGRNAHAPGHRRAWT